MYSPPNPNVDHLDPANWWPHYDMASDRRAIPAQAVVNLRAYNALTAFTYLREEEGDPASWAEVLELEEDLPTRVITVEFGPGAVRRLAPDQALYVAQGDFARLLPELPAALTATFDALWAHHQAGRISRSAFDARAADLRGMRDHITTVLQGTKS